MRLRWYGAILISFFVMALPSGALANFSDVPDVHSYALEIQTLKDAGIVAGYPDGTFKPDASVSRAEAAAIIMKAAGITAEKSSQKIPFTDVPETAWFFSVIQKGVAMGKLKGYVDKTSGATFRPGNPVTLPEALALTISFFRVGVEKVDVQPVIYEGLDPKEWYAKHAQFAKNKNLIEPDSTGRIDPAKALTRGQLVQIIYRMRIFQETQKPFDITKGWIITEHLDNFWRVKHPPDWQIFKGQKNSVLWKATFKERFFTRVWPRGARLTISLIENTENFTLASFKENFKNSHPGLKPNFADILLSGQSGLRMNLPERRIMDIMLRLPNNNFLSLETEYGEAPIGEFLKKQLEEVLLSYEYVARPPEPPKPVIPMEERMMTLRENILIENKWNIVAPLFPDKKIIHTDGIGIGTGPVDYYHSKEANHTIKLERNSGTVLNIREGQTSAF